VEKIALLPVVSCYNLLIGIALNVRFTTNRMCVKKTRIAGFFYALLLCLRAV